MGSPLKLVSDKVAADETVTYQQILHGKSLATWVDIVYSGLVERGYLLPEHLMVPGTFDYDAMVLSIVEGIKYFKELFPSQTVMLASEDLMCPIHEGWKKNFKFWHDAKQTQPGGWWGHIYTQQQCLNMSTLYGNNLPWMAANTTAAIGGILLTHLILEPPVDVVPVVEIVAEPTVASFVAPSVAEPATTNPAVSSRTRSKKNKKS